MQAVNLAPSLSPCLGVERGASFCHRSPVETNTMPERWGQDIHSFLRIHRLQQPSKPQNNPALGALVFKSQGSPLRAQLGARRPMPQLSQPCTQARGAVGLIHEQGSARQNHGQPDLVLVPDCRLPSRSFPPARSGSLLLLDLFFRYLKPGQWGWAAQGRAVPKALALRTRPCAGCSEAGVGSSCFLCPQQRWTSW